MRELKFRAWDTKQKEIIPSDAWYFNEEFEPFIDSVKSCIDNGYLIMQYTGLKDKSGVEIYEGDIVRYNFNNSVIDTEDKYLISEVYMHELRNCYAINAGSNANNDLWRYTSQGENSVEVIGNIHENPELL